MKRLIFVSFILASSCTTFKSGLSIPPNETFILGESNSKNYSAELVNTSNYEVKIRGEKKQNGEYTQGFSLAPKGKAKVNVKEIYGMRYIKN